MLSEKRKKRAKNDVFGQKRANMSIGKISDFPKLALPLAQISQEPSKITFKNMVYHWKEEKKLYNPMIKTKPISKIYLHPLPRVLKSSIWKYLKRWVEHTILTQWRYLALTHIFNILGQYIDFSFGFVPCFHSGERTSDDFRKLKLQFTPLEWSELCL